MDAQEQISQKAYDLRFKQWRTQLVGWPGCSRVKIRFFFEGYAVTRLLCPSSGHQAAHHLLPSQPSATRLRLHQTLASIVAVSVVVWWKSLSRLPVFGSERSRKLEAVVAAWLDPRLPGFEKKDDEPSNQLVLAEDVSVEGRVDQMKKLNQLYGTKKSVSMVFGLMTKPLVRLLLPAPKHLASMAVSEPASTKSFALPLLDKQDSEADIYTPAKPTSFRMLLNTPSHVHYYWRKFDNAFMRPMFGGRGFVPGSPH